MGPQRDGVTDAESDVVVPWITVIIALVEELRSVSGEVLVNGREKADEYSDRGIAFPSRPTRLLPEGGW